MHSRACGTLQMRRMKEALREYIGDDDLTQMVEEELTRRKTEVEAMRFQQSLDLT
jgi:hypothetical protein